MDPAKEEYEVTGKPENGFSLFLVNVASLLTLAVVKRLARWLGYSAMEIEEYDHMENPANKFTYSLNEKHIISSRDISKLIEALENIRLRGVAKDVQGFFEQSNKKIKDKANKKYFLELLKAKYKKLYDAVQPVPYIKDKLYCVERVFVEGGIESYVTKWVPLDSYHDVFTNRQHKYMRRILIGEPGYGKSTLTLQFAYDWCNSVDRSYLKDVEILILLRLRQLGGVESIYKAIKQFILPSNCQLREDDIESIIETSSSVVVILDGFDEYPDEESIPMSDVMKMIITSSVFHQLEVILTTRYLPKKYASNTNMLRLSGFDNRAREEYIKKAVVGNDVVAANKIKQQLEGNPILADLCQVPLFFVFFAHMSHENENFQTIKTVTSFFQYLINCFHSHLRNKMENVNVQRFHTLETDHNELDEIAFGGLSKEKQQIVWKKSDLTERLGKDFYDQYLRTGILVEEEVIEDFSDSVWYDDSEKNVRFYHKIFCEWYAAHFLVRYVIKWKKTRPLSNILCYMDPLDLQYCYRFACGLNPAAAVSIIKYLNEREGGEKFSILCVVEQESGVEDILDTVRDLCENQIQFKKEDSQLLQRSTVQLLQIASNYNLSISWVRLSNCYSTVDLSGGNHLQLKSNVFIPVLASLNQLTIYEEHREITAEEFEGILQYSSKCPSLKELWFHHCQLPQAVQKESVSVLRSRNAEVWWLPDGYYGKLYSLNLLSGLWQTD